MISCETVDFRSFKLSFSQCLSLLALIGLYNNINNPTASIAYFRMSTIFFLSIGDFCRDNYLVIGFLPLRACIYVMHNSHSMCKFSLLAQFQLIRNQLLYGSHSNFSPLCFDPTHIWNVCFDVLFFVMCTEKKSKLRLTSYAFRSKIIFVCILRCLYCNIRPYCIQYQNEATKTDSVTKYRA